MSLFIETNVYLFKKNLWDCLSKLSCLDILSNNDSSLERSIVETLLGVVGAFGIALRASNTLPYSFVLMYSPQVSRNMLLLCGSLCNITFHHELEKSSKQKTCWTHDGKTNVHCHSSTYAKSWPLKIQPHFIYKLDYPDYIIMVNN